MQGAEHRHQRGGVVLQIAAVLAEQVQHPQHVQLEVRRALKVLGEEAEEAGDVGEGQVAHDELDLERRDRLKGARDQRLFVDAEAHLRREASAHV